MMTDWYSSLTTLQQVFAIFAAIGSILFVIQLVWMFIGGDMDADADVDADLDLDVDADVGAEVDAGAADMDHGGGGSDASFKLLSYQGLTAFFMMFGLAGLAMSRGSGYGALLSLGVGMVVGSGSMLLVAKLYQFFKNMQSSGTINLRNAIGEQARVYLTIKEDEPGQIEVSVQGHLKIYDAVSEDKIEIPTDARVRVVDVVSEKIMVVTRL